MKKYLAIDIGGTYIKYGTVDRGGNLKGSQKISTPQNLSDLLSAIDQFVVELKAEVAGVGVSAPGRVNSATGTIFNGGSLPFLHNFSFKKHFAEKYHLHCAVSNDGKAAALAELWLGNLQQVEYGAAIVLGTGVGGGLLADGKILQGSHFQAGELSFLPTSSRHFTLESSLATSGSAVKFIQQGAELLNLADKSDGQSVFNAIIAQNNHSLNHLFAKYCHEIAFSILSLQAILDISKVVIGGGISAQPILIEGIRQSYLDMRKTNPLAETSFPAVEIEVCKFGNEANLLGAIYQLFLDLDKE